MLVKEIAELSMAFKNGKIIEAKTKGCEVWFEAKSFDEYTENNIKQMDFRIKPEPKLRPWKPEEVPVGAIIRQRGHDVRVLITGCGELVAIGQKGEEDINALLRHFEHSTDGGKTWQPCGVYETTN